MNQTMYLTSIGMPPAEGPNDEKVYTIFCADSNEKCGTIVLRPQNPSSVYIWWYLDEQFRGKGYMFDAVAQILPSLLERYHRIVAMIWTTNNRSKQLAARCGFHYESTATHLDQKPDGTWQNVEFWALVEGYHVIP